MNVVHIGRAERIILSILVLFRPQKRRDILNREIFQLQHRDVTFNQDPHKVVSGLVPFQYAVADLHALAGDPNRGFLDTIQKQILPIQIEHHIVSINPYFRADRPSGSQAGLRNHDRSMRCSQRFPNFLPIRSMHHFRFGLPGNRR
ncbi:MAG: hypothetical protein IKI81_07150, partial [Selenomonadaceae bacterium]|nr:hypothetical protein [Selenomonadaceae bacterium]